MKKLLILVFALLICLMATSALAATTTYDSTWNQDIVIADSGEHTVILNGVMLENNSITIQAQETKVTIILKGGTTNVLKTVHSVKGDSEIVIRCESAGEGHECTENCGKLIIKGHTRNAGIGSGESVDFTGSITITSGTVIIENATYGAGIGSGQRGAMSGTITITDSIVTADCDCGAGIGGGELGAMSGTITITDSAVTIEEGRYGAGIGSGWHRKMSGTVMITDSTVTADSYWGAGIGSGETGEMSGTITITDSTVTASGGIGAGIGSGQDSAMSGTIAITNSTVNSTDIGSGEFGEMSGAITITDSTVTANSGWSAGIGSGQDGAMSGTVTITDSTVTARSDWGAGIGSGWKGDMSGTVTITDSTVTANGGRGAGIGAGNDSNFTGKLIMRGNVDVTAIGEYWGIGPGHGDPISEGAEIYVEPTNGNIIGVKQGYDEESAVNLAGTPYSVKTDLIPLLNGSPYVRTRYNTETVTPSPSPKPVTPSPVPVTPSPKPVTPTSCYGGTATCTELAICEDCGKGYGELNKKNHVHKVILPYVPPTTTSTGLTEGLKCGDCQTIIIPQQIIPMLPSDLPQTGDGTNFAFLVLLAAAGMIGMTVILRKKNEA
ncbi:MAG: LPXTG cell wall anchor domain-containing protein [Clostridia bacterium]|nr:LPXTG cell wall anchor domain-containing protein [Clostridia bacterium]